MTDLSPSSIDAIEALAHVATCKECQAWLAAAVAQAESA